MLADKLAHESKKLSTVMEYEDFKTIMYDLLALFRN